MARTKIGASLINLQPASMTTQAGVATFQTTNTTFTNVTGVSASITPTTLTSKIKITSCGSCYQTTAGKVGYITLARGSTNLANSSGMTEVYNATAGTGNIPFCVVILDSPSTLSSVTYNLQCRTDSGGTMSVGDGTNSSTYFILEEVI